MILAASFACAEGVSVIACEGDVKVTPKDGKTTLCAPGMKVSEGSRIVTGSGAYADIAFDKTRKNIVNVKENTEVIMTLSDDNRIELVNGELFASLKALEKGTSFIVKTPSASCGARGTGWGTKATPKATDVSVADGKIFVRGVKKDGSPMDKTFWVGKGFERKIEKFKAPGAEKKMSQDKFNRLRNNYKNPFTGSAKPKDKPEEKKARKGADNDPNRGFTLGRKSADKFEKKPIVKHKIESKQKQNQFERKFEGKVERKEHTRILEKQREKEDTGTSSDPNVIVVERALVRE